MASLAIQKIQNYRKQTYRLNPDRRVTNLEQASAFVKERGFVYFWPIKRIELPSLWTAVAGDRPVADAHDDPGHITWGWKDDNLGKRLWYYAKILRKKATMIDLDVAPYFYALSENYGSPEEDYLIQYHEGQLTLEAKAVFEALLDEGPLDTLALRRAAHLNNQENKARFERALALLQADFKILPIGISRAGGWRYAFIYELVHRHYPELPEKARLIRQREARRKLTELYFRSVGAAQLQDVVKLFGWRKLEAEGAVNSLVEAGILLHELKIEKHPGEWIALEEAV